MTSHEVPSQAPRSERGSISEGDVERIASRVAELLLPIQANGHDDRWVKADAIARRFGVSRGWVYENAGRLGAIRLSDCDRAQLRFNPKVVQARLEQLGVEDREACDKMERELAIHRPRVRRRRAAR